MKAYGGVDVDIIIIITTTTTAATTTPTAMIQTELHFLW
jgi:hypothetical protein